MKKKQSTAVRFTSDVVEQIMRYRMTTLEAVSTLPSARRLGRRRIAGQLRQMCDRGRIAAASLFHQRRYFYLPCDENVDLSNGSQQKHGPLSEEAKIRNYAMLAFCCHAKTNRHRLTAAELTRFLPDIERFGTALNYYLDNSASRPRLGYIRVDTGGRGRWDRILAKLRSDVRLHSSREEVRRLIDQDAFEVTLITARPQKGKRLADELNRVSESQLARVHIAVVPELLHLIAPLPQST